MVATLHGKVAHVEAETVAARNVKALRVIVANDSRDPEAPVIGGGSFLIFDRQLAERCIPGAFVTITFDAQKRDPREPVRGQRMAPPEKKAEVPLTKGKKEPELVQQPWKPWPKDTAAAEMQTAGPKKRQPGPG